MRRRPKPKFSRSCPWPAVLAACPEAARFDAFIRGLEAIAGESGRCTTFDSQHKEYSLTPSELAELFRSRYEEIGRAKAHIDFDAPSGRELQLCANVSLDRRRWPGFALLDVGCWTRGYDEGLLLPDRLPRLKPENPYSTPIEALLAWRIAIGDIYTLVKRFCTASPAITTGCCTEGPDWGAPLLMAATYHADGYPGRDLAMSWIYLHDDEPVDLAAAEPIDALRARVEAAPPGSDVWVMDEDRISREQILAALDVPPDDLVDALERAASEYALAMDSVGEELIQALEVIKNEIATRGEDGVEMVPLTDEHRRYIDEETPAYVTHLDNDALLLYAHPYRTLWPLWRDALAALGIRPLA